MQIFDIVFRVLLLALFPTPFTFNTGYYYISQLFILVQLPAVNREFYS